MSGRKYSEQAFVDLGLNDGRLSIDDKESWERAFEHEPHEAGRRFAQLAPNAEVARRNALGVGEDADYRTTAGARLEALECRRERERRPSRRPPPTYASVGRS